MPALTATEAGISVLSALSTMSKATLSTVLFGTLHLPSIVPLGLGFVSSRRCTPLKVRVP